MQFFTHEMVCERIQFGSDNSEGNFIFQSESYIYMKVADNGIKYMQIPVSIRGTYNPKSHDASFTYKL